MSSQPERWETLSKPLDVWIQDRAMMTPARETSLC